MSSSAFSSTLDLSLRASPGATLRLLVLHAGAIVLTLLADPPRWAGLSLAALFALSWSWLRRHPAFGHGPRALIRLIAHAEGGWTVVNAKGEHDDAELEGSSTVQSWLTVLNFRLKRGGVRTRVLIGDEAEPEALRRLRARLLGGAAGAGNGAKGT